MKKVDVVVIDDDKKLAHHMLIFLRETKNKKVDYFEDLDEFEKNVSQYSKDTFIYLDSFRTSEGIYKGIEMAKMLHELGYTRLYLFSGYDFTPNSIPSYLTVIRKDDISRLEASLDWT